MPIRWQVYIEERKDAMLGKPVFKGTRLTVGHVLADLATGMSHQVLPATYPTLKAEHIFAALLFAAE